MKVTIVVRTCNRPQFLKEALASIQLQTHKDWEVLLFDDGATNENFNIYKKFKDLNKDKRIMYLTTNDSYNMFQSSWLIAPDLAEGDIMVRLDDDDILAEDCLEFLSDLYTKNPELEFSYGSSITFEDTELKQLIQTNTCFDHEKTLHEWAAYTIPNNNPWREPWAFYRNYYTEPRHLTSIIHCAKDNMFCIFHTYVMRTSSVKRVKDKITITSKFVDDLEFLGSLDYLGLGQAAIKKVLSFVRVHNSGRVSDNGRITDNTNIFNENFRIRDKVDELRPSGFLSKVIPLDSNNNFNKGIDEDIKAKFATLKLKINMSLTN
jgi:glycosyltransferase involved in cell wall biosynthesis